MSNECMSIECAAARLPKSYPPGLKKACLDYYDYLIKIKGVEQMIYFNEAEYINDEWVLIKGIMSHKDGCNFSNINIQPSRGVEIRVSEIQFVID